MIRTVVTAAEETVNPLLSAPYDIIWSAVVFVVALLLFWKFALPKMQNLLDERAAAIEGGIKEAEVAQAEAAAALEKNNAELARAREEAAEIREKARANAASLEIELKEQANEEAARIVTNAQARIESERSAAASQLRHEVGTLALDLSEKVVGESMSDERASGIVDRFLADLETQEAGR